MFSRKKTTHLVIENFDNKMTIFNEEIKSIFIDQEKDNKEDVYDNGINLKLKKYFKTSRKGDKLVLSFLKKKFTDDFRNKEMVDVIFNLYGYEKITFIDSEIKIKDTCTSKNRTNICLKNTTMSISSLRRKALSVSLEKSNIRFLSDTALNFLHLTSSFSKVKTYGKFLVEALSLNEVNNSNIAINEGYINHLYGTMEDSVFGTLNTSSLGMVSVSIKGKSEVSMNVLNNIRYSLESDSYLEIKGNVPVHNEGDEKNEINVERKWEDTSLFDKKLLSSVAFSQELRSCIKDSFFYSEISYPSNLDIIVEDNITNKINENILSENEAKANVDSILAIVTNELNKSKANQDKLIYEVREPTIDEREDVKNIKYILSNKNPAHYITNNNKEELINVLKILIVEKIKLNELQQLNLDKLCFLFDIKKRKNEVEY